MYMYAAQWQIHASQHRIQSTFILAASTDYYPLKFPDPGLLRVLFVFT